MLQIQGSTIILQRIGKQIKFPSGFYSCELFIVFLLRTATGDKVVKYVCSACMGMMSKMSP